MKKILLTTLPFLIVGTSMLLSSCSTTSQFSPLIKISAKTANTDPINDKINISYCEKNNNEWKVEDIDLTNYGIVFDGNSAFSIYSKKDEKYVSDSIVNQPFLKSIISGITHPINLATSLINLSHINPIKGGDINEIFNQNLIFNNIGSANIDSFKEFMFASANIANQGKHNQFKLYMDNLTLISNETGPISLSPIKKINNGTYEELKLSVDTYNEENKPKIDKDKFNLVKVKEIIKNENGENVPTYEIVSGENIEKDDITNYKSIAYVNGSEKIFNISFGLSFFDPTNVDVNKVAMDIAKVNEIIKNTKPWGDQLLKVDNSNYSIKFSLQISIRPQFSFTPYMLINKNIANLDELPSVQKNQLSTISYIDTSNQNKQIDFHPEKTNLTFGVKYLIDDTTSFSQDFKNIFKNEKNEDYVDKSDGFSNMIKLVEWIKKIPTDPIIKNDDEYKTLTNEIAKSKNIISFILDK